MVSTFRFPYAGYAGAGMCPTCSAPLMAGQGMGGWAGGAPAPTTVPMTSMAPPMAGAGWYPGPAGFQPGWHWHPAAWIYAPVGPTTLDDDAIAEMIYDALEADPTIPADVDVDVDVSGGIVTLRGSVPSKYIKHKIGDAAWWIPDVVDVNNQITVTRRGERAPVRQRAEQQPATTPGT